MLLVLCLPTRLQARTSNEPRTKNLNKSHPRNEILFELENDLSLSTVEMRGARDDGFLPEQPFTRMEVGYQLR